MDEKIEELSRKVAEGRDGNGDDDFVCGRGGVNVNPDDFCSYGERRTDV